PPFTGGTSNWETITVTEKLDTPVLAKQTATQTWVTGQQVSFMLPAGTFTAYEIFGPNATSWLHFDSKTGILSGTAPATGSAALAIRVTATDSYGLSAMETCGVSYAPAGNAAPTHATWSNSTTTSEMILLKAT
ncbi:MAG: putative Ig domain-containing protein, partial [Rhodopila sp.]